MSARHAAASVLALVLAACGSPRHVIAPPTFAPTPQPGAPIYDGRPATRFALDVTPLGFDSDGNARVLVVARFFDALGSPTRILGNSDVDWSSRDGHVQWQTRMRFGQPSAIVSTNRRGRIVLSAHVREPELGTQNVVADVAAWAGARVVARAVGPYAVQIGWFPQARTATRIERIDAHGGRVVLATLAAPSSTYRDTTVAPHERYRYVVARAREARFVLGTIDTPPPPPHTQIANASGKAMWLFFTTNPIDSIFYKRLDPRAIVAQAVRAGLHYVELRTAYGGFFEITPEARPTIDAIVDGLAAHGIGTIGWTVPRDTDFEDLQQCVATAYYKTVRGTPLTGIAIDVERGDEFMGGAAEGSSALWHYVSYVRAALGPRYLIVSTVEDPFFEHLTQASYPYEQIARASSVLQPMAYWRMMRRSPTSPAQVRDFVGASFATLAREAGRAIPISIGGQTAVEGRNGRPTAAEIAASLHASKSAGAIGEAFFAWDGTQPAQWAALHDHPW